MRRPVSVIPIGRITGAWGTGGWVKVFSLTDPPENIFEYQPWRAPSAPRLFHVRQWRRQGPRLVACLDGINTRVAAEALAGTELSVRRDQLPTPEPGKFYWRDLVGLEVQNIKGVDLGRVAGLIDAGVHDVLEIDAGSGRDPILVPFVQDQFVKKVDLDRRRIIVDWERGW